jgi:hypothetical protein
MIVRAPVSGSSAYLQGDPGSLKIAVTPWEFEDIATILGSMGWESTEILYDDLQYYDTLSQFDIVFITCSELAPLYSSYLPKYHGEEILANLERFVREGGTLYTSDYAYGFVDHAFPGYIRFDDGTHYGKFQQVAADVVDPALAYRLDVLTLPIEFDTPGWISVESVSDEVTIYLSADYADMTDAIIQDKPIAMSFSYGEGRVVYAAFHSSVQSQDDMQSFLSEAVQIEILEAAPPTPETLAPLGPETDTGSSPTLLYVGIALGLCLCGLLAAALAAGAVVLIRKRRA